MFALSPVLWDFLTTSRSMFRPFLVSIAVSLLVGFADGISAPVRVFLVMAVLGFSFWLKDYWVEVGDFAFITFACDERLMRSFPDCEDSTDSLFRAGCTPAFFSAIYPVIYLFLRLAAYPVGLLMFYFEMLVLATGVNSSAASTFKLSLAAAAPATNESNYLTFLTLFFLTVGLYLGSKAGFASCFASFCTVSSSPYAWISNVWKLSISSKLCFYWNIY